MFSWCIQFCEIWYVFHVSGDSSPIRILSTALPYSRYLKQTHDGTMQFQPYQLSCVSLWCEVYMLTVTCCAELYIYIYIFRDSSNVQGVGRPGCDAVSLGTGLQTFWRNEMPSCSNGRQFKQNLTAWSWRWRHYLLLNVSNHSPNALNPQQDQSENLKPRTSMSVRCNTSNR
jgi:hypothetical protein